MFTSVCGFCHHLGYKTAIKSARVKGIQGFIMPRMGHDSCVAVGHVGVLDWGREDLSVWIVFGLSSR